MEENDEVDIDIEKVHKHYKDEYSVWRILKIALLHLVHSLKTDPNIIPPMNRGLLQGMN